jgi:hypothetical protein
MAGVGPRAVLRLYPRWWRARYGAEIEALLDDRPVGFRGAVDLARGALDARMRGEDGRPAWEALAAISAGAIWTVIAVAALTQPAPPDWPGYLIETLPLAVLGAVAVTAAAVGVARRAWARETLPLEVAVLASVAGGMVWAIVLLVAGLGGPYGAITGAAGSLAAVATSALGLAVLRIGLTLPGAGVAVAGVAMLVPLPAAWLVAGAAWTGIGLWCLVTDRAPDPTTGAPA